MADLVLRVATALPPTGSLYTTKNAALTFSEIDNNFIELDTEVHNVIDALPELSATPPVAVDGKIWFDTDNARTYIFNGNTASWEEIGVANDTEISAVSPATPEVGKLWYDTTTNKLFVWDGTQWKAADEGGSTVSPTAPTSPLSGDVWYDTANAIFYVWDGFQWKSTVGSNAAVGPTAPSVPNVGDTWYDSVNNKYYVWDGSVWQDAGGVSNDVTNAAPTSPSTGDLWYDLSTNQLNVYNGATSTWLNASGVTIIDGLNDVISAGALASQILEWDPTATDANGNVGQWVATHTLDASPVGGTTDDF